LPNTILKSLKEVCGAQEKVCLHEPYLSSLEEDVIHDCLKSTYVSSVGKYVDKLERNVATYTGAARAVAVINGTAALQISLLLSGIRDNDEVIIPSLTFAGTANAVCHAGGIPHFVDVEQDSFGICPQALEFYLNRICKIKDGDCVNNFTGRKIAAIVPVHVFGHPCKIEQILEVANKFKLLVVEDAAESLGSFSNGRHTGTFGKFGTISFNGNKIITTGGGGMIITNDESLANQAKHLTTTAKVPHKWEFFHDQVGFNYRMPNLNAALGCAQLERLSEFLDLKRKLYYSYSKNLSRIDGISLVQEPQNCCSNYWLQTILLNKPNLDLRNEILTVLNKAGFMSRPAWTGLHKLDHFKDNPRMDMGITESLEKRIINIPSSSFLSA
jgi:perosamine synthetase